MPGKRGLKHSFVEYLSSDKLLLKLVVSGHIVLVFNLSSPSLGKDAVQTRRFLCFTIGLTVRSSIRQGLTKRWSQSVLYNGLNFLLVKKLATTR